MASFRISQIEGDKANLKDGQVSYEPDTKETVYQPTASAASQDKITFAQWTRESNGDSVLYNANGVELERITPEGNIAYNGASVPTTLQSGSYIFKPNYVEYTDTAGNKAEGTAYRNGTNYISLINGDVMLTSTIPGSVKTRRYIGATIGLNLGPSTAGTGWDIILPS